MPEWVDHLTKQGWEAVHWSEIGKRDATDIEIMAWARKNGHIVFTHDLDFSASLALTHTESPSILQIRGPKVLPEQISSVVVTTIRRYENELEAGAILVVEESKSRIRILPL